MDQPFTYRPSYFVNPEGSTALQNLLNEAKADFFNNRFSSHGQNAHHDLQAFTAVDHSERCVLAVHTREVFRV